MTSSGLLMPPDQKSFQTPSIWLLISPVIVAGADCEGGPGLMSQSSEALVISELALQG